MQGVFTRAWERLYHHDIDVTALLATRGTASGGGAGGGAGAGAAASSSTVLSARFDVTKQGKARDMSNRMMGHAHHTPHHAPQAGGTSSASVAAAHRLELPYNTKFLLVAAYLASFNPPDSDTRYFTKQKTGRRRKRRKTSMKVTQGSPAQARFWHTV